MKKIISLIVTVGLMLSIVVMPQSIVTATEVNQYYADTLTALGILDEYADYEKTVTRGEFTELVLNLLDMTYDNAGTDQAYFRDVPESYEYYKSISVAAQWGLIEGNEGRYYPDRDITLTETVTILMRALGYGDVIEITNALSLAGSKDLLDGVEVNADGKMTLGVMVPLLFNSLLTDIAEYNYSDKSINTDSGKLLLESVYKGREIKGIVTADEFTTLTSANQH